MAAGSHPGSAGLRVGRWAARPGPGAGAAGQALAGWSVPACHPDTQGRPTPAGSGIQGILTRVAAAGPSTAKGFDGRPGLC